MTHLKVSCRTGAEKSLAEGLQQKKLFFKQNQTIAGYEVDFWFPDYGLVVEVDGFTHLSDSKERLDRKKDQILTDKGMVVIRMSNRQIRENMPQCLSEIEMIINKLKSLQNNESINNQWKKPLQNYNVVEKKPAKKQSTIEEYFLSLDEKTD